MKIAVMASGSLGLIVLKRLLDSKYDIAAILTDKGSSGIVEFIAESKIPCFIGNPRGGRAISSLGHLSIDVILSVNYLFLIEEDLIRWPKTVSVNLHGSLLPKYRGRTPHVWSIINGECETGVTAHKISLGCDEGDIIKQVTIPIEADDTGAIILNKYIDVYPSLVDNVLKDIESGAVSYTSQDESKATHFNKRTAESGRINWNWQKERIRNWVRAQADPYPGAFTFLGENKIIIDKVEYDDFGYHQDQPNGLILTMRPIRVKTPNGVLQITSIRSGMESLTENSLFESYGD